MVNCLFRIHTAYTKVKLPSSPAIELILIIKQYDQSHATKQFLIDSVLAIAINAEV